MIDSWKNSTLNHQWAVLAAMTQIGVPYRTNTSVEDKGFDCSGLTSYAWEESGVELQRVSGAQIRNATEVDRASAMAGDLVHYPGHVMMYLGVDNAVVHSVNTGRTVEIDTISQRSVNRVTFGDPSA
jgi:cell wall-associated NlpC family hydrolase